MAPSYGGAFFFLKYSAAGVAAVAAYFRNILVGRISAMIAAVFLIAAHRACTCIMSASVVVSHSQSPKDRSDFAIGH